VNELGRFEFFGAREADGAKDGGEKRKMSGLKSCANRNRSKKEG